jgi:hypothetical protein
MNTSDLIRLGVPPGEASRRGVDFISRYILVGHDKQQHAAQVEAIALRPLRRALLARHFPGTLCTVL